MTSETSQPRNPQAGAEAAVQTILEPPGRWPTIDLGELWKYRELLYFLTWRDIKVRYKQTVLGVLWAILQPVMMMIVFTVVFGRMAKVPTGGVPYPIFVYAGLLPWTFFSRSVSAAAESVVKSEKLVTKIYFPRLAIPISSVGAALVDLAISFLVLVCLMVYYGVAPTWSMILVVPLCLLTTASALGFGCLLAALNVSYRDVRYVVPFFIQIWLFATPSVYMELGAVNVSGTENRSIESINPGSSPASDTTDSDSSPTIVARLLEFNPMTGLISFFRAAVLSKELPWRELAYSASVICCVLIVGALYFARVESSFADIV